MTRLNLLLIAACIGCCLLLLPVSALPADGIPQTPDEIHEYAQQVLREEILKYCSAKYSGQETSHLSSEDLADAVKYYPEYPRRIIDSAHNTITIVRPLSHIVAISPSALGVLDADDRVIGVSHSGIDSAYLVPELAAKTDVGGGGPSEPDLEKILSLHPDAVLTYTQLGTGSDFFDKRMPQGVPVIRLDFIRPSSLKTDMKKLGYLLNCTDRSSAYVAWHDNIMDEIDRRLATIPKNERVRVFVDVWSKTFTASSRERRTATESSYYSESYCTDNGGINIAADLKNPQATVDIEWLAQQNPDVILGSAYHGGYAVDNSSDLKDQYNELMNIPVLHDVAAVKEKRIYILSFRYIMGPSYPAARAQAVKWFYPDLFADMDPTAIHQEYIDLFYNTSYDVRKQGAFIYPE
ncbi:MAG: ABC transporter substrate-binding protein [Methanoregula sp.]|nr:ABC transporter substrate-binding protein [Methanoregula sp.]